MSKQDIPKKTVAVLLIVAITFSIIGTWVIMSKGPAIIDLAQRPGNTARISLKIEGEGTAATESQSSEGKISLIIEPQKGG